MKLIWCSGFSEIYAQLEEQVGSVCHGFMCILLYMKLIWCSGFPEIYAWLEELGWGQSAMGICAYCYIWNLFGVVVLHTSMVNWRSRWDQSAMGICAFCYIWNLVGVVVLHTSMVNWRSRWGQSAMGIRAYCYIWHLFSVVWRYNMCGWYIVLCLFLDNSGSPSIVEQ